MFKHLSSSLIARGIVAIGLGLIAIIWPNITVGAFVFVFAVFAFADAFGQGAQAFSSENAGPVFGHLLLALIDIAAGVVAIAWPGITAYALVIWVGIWAVVSGVVEVGIAFQGGETAGERALWLIAGALSVVFGIVVFANPNAGAVTLALLFGFFSLALGITEVALGVDARRTGQDLAQI
jgi:uncharacterized membrane protein HdeD (DUF308 family)